MKTLTYKNKTSIGVINVHSMLSNNVTTTSSNKLSLILSLCALALSACTQVPDKQLASVEQPSGSEEISISNADREEYKHGLIALNNNDNDEAQKIFNDFIEDKPELAGPYTNLALMHFKNKEYDQSLELINKALARNPKQAQAYQLRAQILVSKGKIHDAKKDYIKAIELKPDYINAQYNLALLYDIYLQEIPLAITHYEIYLSLIKKPDEATKEWVNHLKGTLANG